MGIYAIVSGGYRGYASPQQELDAIKMDLWQPRTIDFCATADRVPGRVLAEVSTVKQFVEYLASPDVTKCKDVVVIGHGNRNGINVALDQVVRSETLAPHTSFLVGTVRPLLKGKAIRLFTCGGLEDRTRTPSIGQYLADMLLVPVHSFDGALWWCHPVVVGDSLRGRGIISHSQKCLNKIVNIRAVIPPIHSNPKPPTRR